MGTFGLMSVREDETTSDRHAKHSVITAAFISIKMMMKVEFSS